MMYILTRDMNATDFAVTRAVQELEHLSTQSAEIIAKHCWSERKSVERSLRRLIRAGLVVRTGCARRGYRYEYVGREESAAAS